MRVRSAVRTSTQEVLPPYRSVVGPGFAREPRVPQNWTRMAVSCHLRARALKPDWWLRLVVDCHIQCGTVSMARGAGSVTGRNRVALAPPRRPTPGQGGRDRLVRPRGVVLTAVAASRPTRQQPLAASAIAKGCSRRTESSSRVGPLPPRSTRIFALQHRGEPPEESEEHQIQQPGDPEPRVQPAHDSEPDGEPSGRPQLLSHAHAFGAGACAARARPRRASRARAPSAPARPAARPVRRRRAGRRAERLSTVEGTQAESITATPLTGIPRRERA